MGKWMQGRQLVLRGKRHDFELPEFMESREPGDPVRQIGFVDIDRTIFKKTAKEKEILKLAKLQAKLKDLKR
jgi:hypothetical protein